MRFMHINIDPQRENFINSFRSSFPFFSISVQHLLSASEWRAEHEEKLKKKRMKKEKKTHFSGIPEIRGNHFLLHSFSSSDSIYVFTVLCISPSFGSQFRTNVCNIYFFLSWLLWEILSRFRIDSVFRGGFFFSLRSVFSSFSMGALWERLLNDVFT